MKFSFSELEQKAAKYFWIALSVLFFILWFYQKSCTGKKPCPEYKTTTTVTHDTIKVEGDTTYVPAPYAVLKILKEKSVIHDTITDEYSFVGTPDSARAGEVDNSVNSVVYFVSVYSDTAKFGDNGYLVIQDSVLGKILNRKLVKQLRFVNTNTVNTVIEKQRNRVFVGLAASYPIPFAGISFAVQNKRDVIYFASVKKDVSGNNTGMLYEAGVLIKIRLRK